MFIQACTVIFFAWIAFERFCDYIIWPFKFNQDLRIWLFSVGQKNHTFSPKYYYKKPQFRFFPWFIRSQLVRNWSYFSSYSTKSMIFWPEPGKGNNVMCLWKKPCTLKWACTLNWIWKIIWPVCLLRAVRLIDTGKKSNLYV